MATASDNRSDLPRLEDLDVVGWTTFKNPRSSVTERLEEAHSLLLLIGAGEGDADSNPSSSVASLNGWIKQRACEGVATLIALAMHHDEVAREIEKRGR